MDRKVKEKNKIYKPIKRGLDIILSGMALIILSPVFIIIAVLTKKKLGQPVIFKQERPGLIDKKTGKERIFTMYKFRSMTDEKDQNGELLPANERLTPYGKKLRSTSLDELPELINIFKGDMSIVGPRPLLVKYLPLYSEVQRKRHLVRPGLTGYAQVNGRNALSWENKLKMDVEYVEKMSLVFDVKIIFKTVITVLKHEGIGSKDEKIIGEFKGNN